MLTYAPAFSQLERRLIWAEAAVRAEAVVSEDAAPADTALAEGPLRAAEAAVWVEAAALAAEALVSGDPEVSEVFGVLVLAEEEEAFTLEVPALAAEGRCG